MGSRNMHNRDYPCKFPMFRGMTNHPVCKINPVSNVLIRCSDTDTLIIMLGNMEHLGTSVKVWMDVGVRNAQWYIDVTKMYDSLGKNLCSSLPGYHALNGCDYNPAFFRKGKKRPLSILQGSEEYQKTFIDLANLEQCDSEQVMNIAGFICHMYNMKKITNVNDARFAVFTKVYANSNTDNFFKPIINNFDGSALPPCQSELHQQLLRALYISNIWRNAHSKYPTILSPIDNCWENVDERYGFRWFEGDQLPTFVNEVVIQPDEGEGHGNHEADNSDNILEPQRNVDDIDDSHEKDDADNEYCQDSDSESEEEVDEEEEQFN